ncbi:hypothetical protein BD779DRAFT_1537012 [Infundibulicybe gibba]|nr:hypothetical protein BD779DRAFT_1537012 [Infundibulicybe gibba]
MTGSNYRVSFYSRRNKSCSWGSPARHACKWVVVSRFESWLSVFIPTTMTVTPDVSICIASVCLEGVLYGLFCALVALYVYLSMKWPNLSTGRNTYPIPVLCFTAFIFVIVTIASHWILSVVQLFQEFIITNEKSPSGNLPSAIIGAIILMVLILTRDLTVIYRVWVICNHYKRSIVVPMMMFATLIGFVAAFVSKWVKGTDKLAMLIGIFVTTFGINLYCTAFIALTMCRAQQLTSNRGLSPMPTFIIAVMVESLALCAVWGGFVLITYGVTPEVFSLALNVQSPITGIAFIMVQVRVGMRRLYTVNSSWSSLDG